MFKRTNNARNEYCAAAANTGMLPYTAVLHNVELQGEDRLHKVADTPRDDAPAAAWFQHGENAETGADEPGRKFELSDRELFGSAFQYAAIGMALVSPNGRFLEVNPALCDLVGYPAEELLELTFQDITHPDDLDTDLEYARQLIAGDLKSYQMEKRYFRKDASIVWVLLSVSLVRDHNDDPLYFVSQVQDISEKKQVAAVLEASEHRFRTMVERAPIGVAVVTAGGDFEQANETFCALLGYDANELIGLHYSVVLPEDGLAYVQARHRYRPTDEATDELELLQRDGQKVTVLARTVPLLGLAGEVFHVVFAVDISERKATESLLHYMAHHDPLTGLANRTLLFDRLDQALAEARRRCEVLGVLFLDLDGFKAVNDRFGHEGGDQLLRRVASRLEAAMRESDIVARFGGDEFVVVLPDIATQEHASNVAQKLLDRLQGDSLVEGQEFTVATSIGISLFPFDGSTPGDLIAHADVAMYRSKQRGKAVYTFFADLGPEPAS